MTGQKTRQARLFFVDNLRIVLIIMVLLWHLAAIYGAGGEWPYQEVRRPDDLTSLVFTLFSAVNGPYVLGFFYLLAGYFTPRSYDRKGPGPFFRDRLLRLGIPMLIYIFVFDPLIQYAVNVNIWGLDKSFWKIWGIDGTFWRYIGRYFKNYNGLSPGPLWFVEGLLIFTIVYGLWRLLQRRIPDPPQRDGKLPTNVAIALCALAVGVVTYIVRIRWPMDRLYRPLGLPVSSFPQYTALFVVGIIAYRGNWFVGISDGLAKLWFRIAIIFIVVLFPAMSILGGALTGDTRPLMGGTHWQAFAYAVWEQFVCVGAIMSLLVWFRKRFNHQGKWAFLLS
jgi:glucan biosynthesis protein C